MASRKSSRKSKGKPSHLLIINPRRARPNPIDELRAPWKHKPGEPRTFDASWNLCLHHARNVPVVIEVLTAGDGEPAEVVVFIVETLRFPELLLDSTLSRDAPRDPATPWAASPAYIEWVKETATRVFRGQADPRETFCIHHTAHPGDNDECTLACGRTDDDHAGWRGLLWSFLNQTSYFNNMDWRTPVVINRDYITDLNHASLPTAELRDLHSEFSKDALAQRDYYENNGDSVDDVPAAYLGDNAIVALLENHFYRCVNEEGAHREEMSNGPGIAVAAEMKWRELTERLAHLEEWEGPFYATKYNQSSAEAQIRDDFEKWLKHEVQRSSSSFNRAEWFAVTEEPAVDGKRGDAKLNDKWLRVCTWEQSTVEEEVSDEVRELLPTHEGVIWAESVADAESFSNDLSAALGRQDITWSGEDPFNFTLDIDCFWVFAIDVNDAVDKLNDLVAEWKADED